MTFVSRPLVDRFTEKYEVDQKSQCWEWKGCKFDYGYGLIHVGKRRHEVAHRVSYRLHCGDIPEGMIVRHQCDNPSCVNPDHLLLGTYLENMADMKSKGRARILTSNQVKEVLGLLDSGYSQTVVGRMFGVSRSTIADAIAAAARGDFGGTVGAQPTGKYVKLSCAQRDDIIARLKASEPIISIARSYDIDRRTVRNIRDKLGN